MEIDFYQLAIYLSIDKLDVCHRFSIGERTTSTD